MKQLHNCVRFCFVLMLALFAGKSSYATHILAMDLYYTWVSGNTYKITAIAYGDCGPASANSFSLLHESTPRVCVFRGGVNIATIDLNIEAPVMGVDITPVCPSQVGHTQCQDPSSTIPGITKFVYSALYTLQAPVNGVWVFGFFGDMGNTSQGSSLAGRSASITNIVNPNPNGTIIQLVDTLINTGGGHNSNAAFSVIPTPFFCLNNNDTYNPGALDPDGDSLNVIDLIPAVNSNLNGGGDSCQFGIPVTYIGTAWNPPFTPISATAPLNVTAGSFNYDRTTGQLNFMPNLLQRSTVVYNVREYRNGQLVGSCQREMNFLVQNCVSIPPTGGIASASNGIIVDSGHYIGCRNSGPFSLQFFPREPNVTNKITVTAAGVPTALGASLTVVNNNTPNPQVTFSWTATGVPAGSYIFYLTYTDDNCPMQGTTTTAVSVKILDSMKVSHLVLSPTTCSSKELIRIIPAGGGAPWSINVSGAPPQVFNNVTGSFIDSLTPGTHVITISSSTQENVCRSSDTIVVLSADISGPNIVCEGSAIMLSDAIAGGTWSSDNTSLATVVSSGAGAGTVTGVSGGIVLVSYTFSDGCAKTATITVKPMPSPIGGNTQVCNGFTAQLSNALAGGAWSSATPGIATIDGSGLVRGVSPGTAIISYTRNGCAVTTTVTVDVQPTATTGSPNICTDGITILMGSPGGGVWSTSNTGVATIIISGSGSDTVAGVFAGATIITYTLGNCSAATTVSVVSFLPPITGPNQVCTGQSVALSDSIIGGTWASINTSVATVDGNGGVVVGVTAGNTVISYTIGGSCIATASMTVNQSPDVGIISGLSDVCVGNTITLSESVAGGTWALTNGNGSISTMGAVTGISPGGDTVFYIVSNTHCTDTASTEIIVHAVPDAGIITGPAAMCTGDVIRLSDAAAGGIWSSVNTAIATVTNTGAVTGIVQGVDSIMYTVSNPGCSTVVQHVVSVYDQPDAGVITGLNRVCAGSSFPLANNVTGGVWTSINTGVAIIRSDTGRVYPMSAGVTTISYTAGPNAGGCYGYATYTVTVLPKDALTINTTVTPTSCYGAGDAGIAVFVTGTPPPFEYSWTNGSTDSVLVNLAPGSYVLHVVQPVLLCMADDSTLITQPEPLQVTGEAKQDLCEQGIGSINTTVTGGTPSYQYLWQTGHTTSDLQNLHAGTFSVVVTDMHGCEQSVTAEVTRNECIIEVFDVITPNGDGINDNWIISGLDNYPQSTVQVFDKWGDIVFARTNYKNDWNGSGKNGLLPDGTYYYVVKLNATNKMGVENTYTGTILIKR